MVYCKTNQRVPYKHGSNRAFKKLFSKKEGYSTYDSITAGADTDKSTMSVVIKNVANDDAELKSLIQDINAYIRKVREPLHSRLFKTRRNVESLCCMKSQLQSCLFLHI